MAATTLCPGELRGFTAAPQCDPSFRKLCYQAPSDVLATRRECLQVRTPTTASSTLHSQTAP
jgi:hypothetical protein